MVTDANKAGSIVLQLELISWAGDTDCRAAIPLSYLYTVYVSPSLIPPHLFDYLGMLQITRNHFGYLQADGTHLFERHVASIQQVRNKIIEDACCLASTGRVKAADLIIRPREPH
jgi:hypothetical protein